MKYGYDEDTIYVISSNHISPVLQSLLDCDKIKSSFYIYNDERINSKYSSSLRPHLLERLFNDNPEFNNETILYIDPDVVFTKKIDFTDMINDEYWHLSDTRSYIDSKYIRSKSDQLFNEMCSIVKVDPNDIIGIDDAAGGAQYLMKNVNSEFWKKVYDDCESLYDHMRSTEHIYMPEYPIQSWTADMWSVLWNAIYFGHKVKINKDLDFSWATDGIHRWYETNIFHVAGVVSANDTHFYKCTYQVSPFNKEISIMNNNCTFNYVKEIKETAENFKDIIW
jgi:hypothetical protein